MHSIQLASTMEHNTKVNCARFPLYEAWNKLAAKLRTVLKPAEGGCL